MDNTEKTYDLEMLQSYIPGQFITLEEEKLISKRTKSHTRSPSKDIFEVKQPTIVNQPACPTTETRYYSTNSL